MRFTFIFIATEVVEYESDHLLLFNGVRVIRIDLLNYTLDLFIIHLSFVSEVPNSIPHKLLTLFPAQLPITIDIILVKDIIDHIS